MSNDQMEDFKQFFDARLSQLEARLGERIDTVEQTLENLEKKVDNGFVGMAEAVEHNNERLDRHETQTDLRLTGLEQAS